MKKALFWLLGIFIFLVLVTRVFAAYPDPKGYVNDFAQVLKPETEKTLSTKLTEYDKKTTNQIAVVTVKTTANESIEDYTYELFRKWGVGQKEKNNGVMMVFAMDDRQMRIEPGRGLEGDITDIEAKHILDDVIKPEFKKGNYDTGVIKGVDAVILSIDTVTATASASTNSSGGLILFIIILIVIAIIIFIALSPYTPLGGSGDWGYDGLWAVGSAIGSAVDSSSDNDGFGGFGGGSSSGGGASSSW